MILVEPIGLELHVRAVNRLATKRFTIAVGPHAFYTVVCNFRILALLTPRLLGLVPLTNRTKRLRRVIALVYCSRLRNDKRLFKAIGATSN